MLTTHPFEKCVADFVLTKHDLDYSITRFLEYYIVDHHILDMPIHLKRNKIYLHYFQYFMDSLRLTTASQLQDYRHTKLNRKFYNLHHS